ncbi:hypothetical protein F0Z19_0323 [Vibrio cyclitrophicus]|nr:hypothetical protein F0Z19_0323 [Vibrio cyclitrophicus]
MRIARILRKKRQEKNKRIDEVYRADRIDEKGPKLNRYKKG